MKKIVSSFLLLSTVAVLSACQSDQTKEVGTSSTSTSIQTSVTSSQQSTSTSSSSETTTHSSTKKEVDDPAYRSVVENYASHIGAEVELNPEEINTQLSLVVVSPQQYTGPYYSLYDVEKDGIDELLIALESNGNYFLIDLYTLVAGGDLVRLVDSLHQVGPEIGEQVVLLPLEDGSYSLQVENALRLYRYNNHIPGLKKVAEGPSDSPAVDLKGLSWEKIVSR